jgi:hypothetical protein
VGRVEDGHAILTLGLRHALEVQSDDHVGERNRLIDVVISCF